MGFVYKQMAEDWISVFGKEVMDEMPFSLVNFLTGYDSSFQKHRVGFAAHLGITRTGAEYLDRCGGKDELAIDLILADEESNAEKGDDADTTNNLNPTSSVPAKENAAGWRQNFCTPKEDEMREFLQPRTDLQRAFFKGFITVGTLFAAR
jgi:hypothetical protein